MRVRLPQAVADVAADARTVGAADAATDHDEPSIMFGASFAFADDGHVPPPPPPRRSRGFAAGEAASCGFAIYGSLNRRVVPPKSTHCGSRALCASTLARQGLALTASALHA